ncbi:MAG: hypothetical protein E7638_04155 [Ruminococcaceae bacterium]|nr:hypothetical protein [Oscillospiraceae bacterium]
METKRNIKYFTAPPLSVLTIIGIVVMVVGVILFAFAEAMKFQSIIILFVGLCVTIFSSGGKANDTDLEYQAAERIKSLQEMAEKKYEVYEKHFLKMMKPIQIKGYDFEAKEEPFYYRKGADGKNRTNYYTGCNLIFTSEKLYIYGRRFSMTDELIDQEIAATYFYNELEKAELEENTYTTKKGDRTINVPVYVMKILKKDGTEALRMCVEYGSDIDKYIEQITRVIQVRQVELEKRAQETAERRAAFRKKIEEEKAAEARGELVE